MDEKTPFNLMREICNFLGLNCKRFWTSIVELCKGKH